MKRHAHVRAGWLEIPRLRPLNGGFFACPPLCVCMYLSVRPRGYARRAPWLTADPPRGFGLVCVVPHHPSSSPISPHLDSPETRAWLHGACCPCDLMTDWIRSHGGIWGGVGRCLEMNHSREIASALACTSQRDLLRS